MQDLADAALADVIGRWKDAAAPSPIWAQFEDMVTAQDDRRTLVSDARLKDGRLLACRFTPLSGGATMAVFHLQQAQSSTNPQAQASELRLA
mgnify:CR=1 FL=1